ncbi:hypothetical protein [Cronobacter turicensis]|uniref:hypothetical protein n=1 Tax=Cronobacter turicensis TaxID=413502 RepID=UPI0014130586|nr:hypothetical protein [Cronobacter turicensis]NHV08007.1 hypothetical protein [Cronobacter turicensis]
MKKRAFVNLAPLTGYGSCFTSVQTMKLRDDYQATRCAKALIYDPQTLKESAFNWKVALFGDKQV